MLKSLKKPSGASRVLHSAATHFHRRQRQSRKLSKKASSTELVGEIVFWKAGEFVI